MELSPVSASLVRFGDVIVPDGLLLEHDAGELCQRLVLRATQALSGIATGRFAQPSASVRLQVDGEANFLGFAYTQFALPVIAGPELDFDFNPAPNLRSPSVLGMLLARVGRRYVWLAPLDQPHEQVIAVVDGTLRWGWHGDLDDVPPGLSTTLGIFEGDSVGEVLERWSGAVRAGQPRRRRAANAVTSHLSYWTDNGAAYWYRTEPGRSIGASVADAVEALVANGVPVRAVELDSWCYHHEVPRPITEIGYPEEVPPSGMLKWEARGDAFDPTDGDDPIEQFSRRLGNPPLVIHARHISPASPYLAEGEWWVDKLAAQPVDPTFFRRWFDDARRWGVCAIEQDWMLLYWFGVRALRAVPSRAADWQRTLDALAAEADVGLIWSMATPADLVLAAALAQVVAVRTCDDYRFAADAALLWTWYLTVNRVVGPLGLPAFKDCFFSRPRPAGGDAIDGDEHAEVEALLACMSAGPVGIGDRLGCTDQEIVMRTCDDDGRIRHVDHPLSLIDDCLFGEPARGERLAWATTTSTRAGEVWTYVVALNTSTDRRIVADKIALADIGVLDEASVYDWRRRTVSMTGSIAAELAPRDWALWVCAPPGERADTGDLDKYVTVESELD